MQKHLYTLRFLFLIILILGCSKQTSTHSNSIQIKGSDTMVNLAQAWAEEFMKENPEISIAVTGGGSGTGISSLISNTCDIAEVSREMKEKEIKLAESKGIMPVKFVVALDGIVVAVNPSNKVSQLTLDQLADIYTGKIKNWKDVGGHNAKIVLLSREVNSGTHVYFKEHVLRHNNPDSKEEFSPEALLLPSSQAIVDELSQNPDAIGYFGLGYKSERVKLLKIARDKNSPPIEPTIESIKNGSYPISRPLLMYTREEPTGAVKKFLDFVFSEKGQHLVQQLDFVPVTM
ncbi:MAG: PstS family phosphate ABC transporter substrate-binding protein [Bacteroidetes bacterium]|nr:PstS family phosphate ABC transporter substrate-binding protein [Bacteroidota bacterium]